MVLARFCLFWVWLVYRGENHALARMLRALANEYDPGETVLPPAEPKDLRLAQMSGGAWQLIGVGSSISGTGLGLAILWWRNAVPEPSSSVVAGTSGLVLLVLGLWVLQRMKKWGA